MAPKNLSALEKDESEEEESSSSQEEEEESSSEENSNQKLQNPKTPKPPSSSSLDDDDEDEDDDDDDEEEKEEEDVPTNTSKNQQQEAKHTPKTALQVQKVDDDQKEDSTTENTKFIQQKGKGEDSKAAAVVVNSFARVWSQADEISILKGMIDQNQKGVNPHADMNAFHEFVKGRIGFEVTKSQLSDKVRRLKKKFFNNVKKVNPNLSKPRDDYSFKLSKKIWGTTNANNQENVVDENDGKAKKSGKVKSFEGKPKEHDKKNEEVEGMEVDFSSGKYPYLMESFDADIFPMSKSERKFMKRNIGLIDSEKAMGFEENWKRLRMEEIEFFCRRSKLMIKQTKSVMRAMRKR